MERSSSTPANERGVGLIEILISVVILSIGFLAAARMQVEGMRQSQSAYYQSQAYFMANEMINRMRTNQVGVRNGFYDDFETASGLSDPGCGSKACTPREIRDQDRYDWSAHLHPSASGEDSVAPVAALPSTPSTSAKGTITSLNDGRYELKLTWPEVIDNEEKIGDLTLNFVTEFE